VQALPERPAERRHRILVVEDDADVRQVLAVSLELEGYVVDQVDSATRGLERLRETAYDLVLSDYALPDRTGAWMLQQARREGLLERTAALVVTAHPDPQGVDECGVLRKPLNFDQFVEQIAHVLRASTRTPVDEAARSAAPDGIELVLYVSSASSASLQVQRRLATLLARFRPSDIRLRVCDLQQDPRLGDEDRIVFTPTLVKRAPAPPVWIVGNLDDPSAVADILIASGAVPVPDAAP
jgi:two-component system response regulator GlrR